LGCASIENTKVGAFDAPDNIFEDLDASRIIARPVKLDVIRLENLTEIPTKRSTNRRCESVADETHTAPTSSLSVD